MPISADEAAQIARIHGLTLTDASALANLAVDVDHAQQLAAQFQQQPQPPSIDMTTDETRRRSLADSISHKSAQLAGLQSRTDRDGRIGPPTPLPVPIAADPEPTPSTEVIDVDQLRPGALPPTSPPKPTIEEMISAAERAGDWVESRRLKTAWGLQLHDRASDAAEDVADAERRAMLAAQPTPTDAEAPDQ